MQREEFRTNIARLRNVVALAGTTQVESYKRISKSGKVVDVKAHTRSVEGMSNPDLFQEYKTLTTGKTDLPEQQKRNRVTQVVNEIRSRKEKGQWGYQANKAETQGSEKPEAPEPKSLEPSKRPEPRRSDDQAVDRDGNDRSEEAPAEDSDEDPENEPSEEQRAVEAAKSVFERATDAEPSASDALKKVVDSAGGNFFGWEHRLKTKDSLARKIRDRFNDPEKFEGLEGEERWKAAEAAMGDSLRYTVVAKAGDYTEMAESALEELRKSGHTVAKVDNFWGDGGSYFGTHADMVSPSGLKWELQFHTPDSMARKDISHFWYDFYRDRSLPPEVRDQARARSAGAWKGLERPTGWEEFGTQIANRTEDTHVGGSGTQMDQKSIPPTVSKQDGVETVEWGGWKFIKSKDQWQVVQAE